MTSPAVSVSRRDALVAGIGLSCVGAAAHANVPRILAEDYWVNKGDVRLYVYRKRLPQEGGKQRPVLFLVHGSSFSGRGTYDLHVPGHSDYSLMDAFATFGFDVWTMDHENYGRSTRNTGSNSDIMSGVADLEAAIPLVVRLSGRTTINLYGGSSGAIRAGAYAMRHPEIVERLILDAFTWKGDGAPEIMRRKAQIESYRASPTRKIDRAAIISIFSRDDPKSFDPAVAAALADYEFALGDQVPNGTYIDMAIHLPMVDPTKISCPVLMIRAQTDGNATEEELLAFFSQLPNRDKQFIMLRGIAHVGLLETNRKRVWHVMQEFITLPPTVT
jgi:pimeloyl-ACP methyl ester carboxylesterase